MDKEKAIKEFVNFVEGRMSFEEFWRNYENNNDYKKLLDDKKPLEVNFARAKGRTVYQMLQIYNESTALDKLNVWHILKTYLQHYKIPCTPTMKYEEDVKFRQAIQPSYISIEDEEYFNSIIATAPTDLTPAQQKKWLKEKIKDLFRYDKSPPRWIQDPEWPIVGGKPLVFKSQTKNDPNDERIWYTFYDPETGEETTVMQFH